MKKNLLFLALFGGALHTVHAASPQDSFEERFLLSLDKKDPLYAKKHAFINALNDIDLFISKKWILNSNLFFH